MRNGKRIGLCFLLPGLLCAGPAVATAADIPPEQVTLSLTRPGDPGVLILGHGKGNIRITGYDGEVVFIEAFLRYPDEDEGGRRPVSNHALQLRAIEKENVVHVSTNSTERTIDLVIRVPRFFSLQLEKQDQGDVDVHGLNGEMDLSSLSGDVRVTGIEGSAVVYTVDGDIRVEFSRFSANVPMAFSSVEGAIQVAFPPDAAFYAKMKSDYGNLFSDFSLELEKRKAEGGRSDRTGISRIYLEEWTYGRVNGGGAELLFRTVNGDITLQKNPVIKSDPGEND
jgi:hypothetical protein